MNTQNLLLNFVCLKSEEFRTLKSSYSMLSSLSKLYLSLDTNKISYKELLRVQEDIDNIVKHKIDVKASAIAKVVGAIFGKKK
ncbi:hypothetical protein F0310_04585 (plasmid) [Borrelia sp. A-FGy1]|uniref:hypothetical protein n=1 Tax=Borrelia sp. A-FGy1 TaxID=2608247 RepID=UPI0015F47DAC|nr:hypothetical protein [Borrelia sp. A-FGy1]QMU99695.1 hypothetical protein F0310_04585 [Borrelia sp. A-FGy1]